jgi:hypothetical protein
MTDSRAINAIAAVITVAAWAGLYLVLHPRPPGVDYRPHAAVGEVLAAEAVELAEPGARLIVIARDPTPYRVPASDAQLNGFLNALKKSGRSVDGIRKVKLDPLRLVAVPPGDFFDQIRLGRNNDVIVSFLGPPVLDNQQLAKLATKRPKILAVCSGAMPGQVDLRRLFHQQLLTAAVISRADAPTQAASGGRRSVFDRMFRLVTATNLNELPEPAVASN